MRRVRAEPSTLDTAHKPLNPQIANATPQHTPVSRRHNRGRHPNPGQMKTWNQQQTPEAPHEKRYSQKFREIHRKTPVPESPPPPNKADPLYRTCTAAAPEERDPQNQICGLTKTTPHKCFPRIWSDPLKKPIVENFIFCSVWIINNSFSDMFSLAY